MITYVILDTEKDEKNKRIIRLKCKQKEGYHACHHAAGGRGLQGARARLLAPRIRNRRLQIRGYYREGLILQGFAPHPVYDLQGFAPHPTKETF